MSLREAQIMTVVALGPDDSTVVVSDGSDDGITVPCLTAYNPRLVNDKVLVVRLAAGSWLVVDAIGPTRSPVTYGVGTPPGGGWRRSTTAYVRDNSDGSRSIYLDTTGSVPMPATVPATGGAGFRSFSTARSDTPRAGAELLTVADWYGAWYYSGTVQATAVAGTVGTMTIKITRTSAGSGAAPVTLGLHSAPDNTAPAVTDQWATGVSLVPGGSASILIPTAQAAKLANGSALGVAVVGQGVAAYAVYTAAAPITITFA